MKWFKHHSDAYSNLKHQQVMAEFGLEGYGFYWICVELVAQQGDNFKVKGDKNWKKALCFTTHKKHEEMEAYLIFFAGINLIDKKALENNDLFIPKMKDHQDEYTESKRRKSRQSRDNVGLEENRTEEEKKRIEEIYKQFKNKIQPKAKLLPKGKEKISKRLETFSIEDMSSAIHNFSEDTWWMENNAHRGIAWFFHSDERIEQLMNLKPKKVAKSGVTKL